MPIETEVKAWGNSLGIILPAEKVRELRLRTGDKINVEILAKKRIDAFGIAKGKPPFEEELFEHEDIE